ncbi:MAG: 16S rRNA (adenine(1518)-N(6)/adenine(1519)-N(6))-dimethyltransferase RsmA [Planctomycetota bacterium]
MTQRPPFSVFRAALESRGFRPSRRLGQNFLLDENMVRAIVRDAEVLPGSFVLEVGAGCGFLSLHLLDAGAELVCVEIDSRLVAIARDLLAPHGAVRFLECDALSGKHALAPEIEAALPEERPWHLVSNLPYSISGPLLAVLAGHERPPRTMTVLVQKEVAERIAANPGTPAWGPLSIRLQLRYAPRIVRSVGPGLFWPRPSVESAVVRLEWAPAGGTAAELARLDHWIGELFSSRRQSLGRVLTRLAGDRQRAIQVLEALGIEPERRAETLDLPLLASLARHLEPWYPPGSPQGRQRGRGGYLEG